MCHSFFNAGILVIYRCIKNYPKTYWLKTTHIPIGQEPEHDLTGSSALKYLTML